MPTVNIEVQTEVERSIRVLQMESMFDVPPTTKSKLSWSVNASFDDQPWAIGLITGGSGSGKTTAARRLFPGLVDPQFEWSTNQSVLDGFPAKMGIKDVVGILSAVGFSSPPSWLRPYHLLSNGEQFRAYLARTLAEAGQSQIAVVDEYSSVVDRQVAQACSAAVAKLVRRTPDLKFVAVTCHEDVADWLCPDWILEMPSGQLTRRSLRRPPIELEIDRVGRAAWPLFRPHHYLSGDLNPAAQCFGAFWRGRIVAFAAVISAPGRVSFFREHRCVCAPDYQGLGIGNALSTFVAGVYAARGKPYRSTTANPAMAAHRSRSPHWKLVRAPALVPVDRGEKVSQSREGRTRATGRLTAGWEYTGPVLREEARRMGVV